VDDLPEGDDDVTRTDLPVTREHTGPATDRVRIVGAEPAGEVVILAEAGLDIAAAEVARICRTVRSVAVDYEPKSLRAKMRSANKLGARWVVLLSAAEVERRVAQLKDMASGDQVEVAWSELVERLS